MTLMERLENLERTETGFGQWFTRKIDRMERLALSGDLIREYKAAAEILTRLSSDEDIEALGQTIRDSDKWLERNGIEKDSKE